MKSMFGTLPLNARSVVLTEGSTLDCEIPGAFRIQSEIAGAGAGAGAG